MEDTQLSRFSTVIEQGSPDPLDRLLDVDPLGQEVVVVSQADGSDFPTAREGIHRVLGKMETALDDLMAVAKQSQHPRAYEVVNQIAKGLLDGYKDLLEIKKKAIDLEEAKPGEGGTTVNNNLMLVNSNELFDQIKALVKPK